MDSGTRLVLQAILQGLRSSGSISASALTVIVDELRYASREADEQLLAPESEQIRRLAQDLVSRNGFEGMRSLPSVFPQRSELDRSDRGLRRA